MGKQSGCVCRGRGGRPVPDDGRLGVVGIDGHEGGADGGERLAVEVPHPHRLGSQNWTLACPHHLQASCDSVEILNRTEFRPPHGIRCPGGEGIRKPLDNRRSVSYSFTSRTKGQHNSLSIVFTRRTFTTDCPYMVFRTAVSLIGRSPIYCNPSAL